MSKHPPKRTPGWGTKPQLQLIPPVAKELEASTLFRNAEKHGGQWNWREPKNSISLMEYLGKIQRHTDAIAAGEHVDAEGHDHLGAIRADAGIIADARLHGTLIDDRPMPRKKRGRK